MARHGALHITGSYQMGLSAKSSRSFRGVYKHAIGTTAFVASIRDDGQAFHENRIPSFQSFSQPPQHATLFSMFLPALQFRRNSSCQVWMRERGAPGVPWRSTWRPQFPPAGWSWRRTFYVLIRSCCVSSIPEPNRMEIIEKYT